MAKRDLRALFAGFEDLLARIKELNREEKEWLRGRLVEGAETIAKFRPVSPAELRLKLRAVKDLFDIIADIDGDDSELKRKARELLGEIADELNRKTN